jgi:hypothetical protein
MLRFALLAVASLTLLSNCQLYDSIFGSPLSVTLKADRTQAFPLQKIILTAKTPEYTAKTLTYHWYLDGVEQIVIEQEKGEGLYGYASAFAESPSTRIYSVSVTDGSETVQASVDVLISPYEESDAASLTVVNASTKNIWGLGIMSAGGGEPVNPDICDTLLTSGPLEINASITFSNLMPGWYMIGAKSIDNEYLNGIGPNLGAGSNTLNYRN